MITPTELDEGVRLAVGRSAIERAIIVALLRSRRRGMASAEAAGVTKDNFDQPDLRAIYVAVDHSRWLPLSETLKSAKRMLSFLDKWDETIPRGSRGMHWSSATFAEAAACTTTEMDEALAALPAMFEALQVIDAVWRIGRAA